MNTKIKCYLLFLPLLLINFGYAQETGNDRMKRDIEVAENILATLLNEEKGFYHRSSVTGTYMEGYGAIFSIGKGSAVIAGNDLVIYEYGSVLDLRSKNGKKDSSNPDSLQIAAKENIKNIAKIFLTDYAHLLSQLKSGEKILLRYGSRRTASSDVLSLTRADVFTTSEDNHNDSRELTIEITKSAIDDFRAGKLTQAQLEEQIKFTEQSAGGKRETDLELLRSIFNRLYQGDLSTTYRLIENADYERVEGLGAIYKMSFGYSTRSSRGFFYNSAGGTMWSREGLEKKPEMSEEEWKKEVTEQFPAFLEDFKKNLIEYGRTVKNLNTNELLAFNLYFHFCDECNIPKKVELSVKKSVLEEYDKNKITLAQAVEKITVKETRD